MLRFLIIGWLLLQLCGISQLALAQEDPDLIIYYDYEAIEGGVVLDQSGNGHNGTVNGSVELVPDGKRGNAAKFSGGGFLDLDGPNFPAEHIPIDAVTIAAWVKCEKTGGDHAIFNARASDSTWLVHPELKSGGNFRWLLRTDGGATIFDLRGGVVEWDTWLHYAGTYSRSDGAILYINGKAELNQGGGATIAKDWGMGARVGKNVDEARPFTGLMDDFTIYKRALTQEEIQIQMESGPPSLMAVSPQGKIATTWAALKR